ncbi:cellular communication network factor 4a isoform X2 [Tachysurus fulvidraco]|uniref:cellular communication network factor 4a isoform X2 n=1 Tax=Tachysurus fulvidraco TaxID=1234273 RepID=UPI000F4DBB9E|nr:cellular communication network factor 4a isoform X2 [Tachysurus fulvidraco]
MSWLLSWVLLVIRLHQAVSLISTIAPPITDEPYNRTQYCKWPCTCPETPPTCPPGVSLIMDGCDCCRACAKQVGEECNEADNCDHHRGLYCDYSSDKPRYEKGVCAYLLGTGCEHNGVIYRNGQSFQPNCKYQCLCVNGAIGCVPLCNDSQPPRVWCPTPRRVKIPGRCCEQWICEEPRRGRKAAPRHAMAALSSGKDTWQENCVTQTTSWSPCSKTCGRGVSLRLTNANKQCQMVKERRLCNIRPCEVDITKHIKVGIFSDYCNPLNTTDPSAAWKKVPKHLQGRSTDQPHHLRLHQQKALLAKVLWCLHRRALLHPL